MFHINTSILILPVNKKNDQVSSRSVFCIHLVMLAYNLIQLGIRKLPCIFLLCLIQALYDIIQ